MKQIKLALFLLLLIFLVASCGILNQGTPTAKKQWTFMLYLDGDEVSMQQDFNAALTEMISNEVGSSDDVNVVIQYDRYFLTAEAFGGWRIAHRFYYTPGLGPTAEAAIADWGDGLGGGREVDTSDPDTLAAFISWATTNYPADHYALLLGDHGYGWQGLIIDMTSDGNFMTLIGMVRALSNSGVQLDLLALDACTMQMNEVMHELRNLPIEIVVGSENLGTTWPLSDIIQTLTNNPAITAEALGTAICDLYFNAHASDDQITLSTIRLAEINNVSNAVQDLAETMLASAPFTSVQAKAAIVMDRIEAAMVYVKNGASWESAAGLSIYFPANEGGMIPDMFNYNYINEITSFAKDTSWRNFLYVYFDMYGYQGVIPGEVYHARIGMPLFDGDKIDLYDFCKRIVEY
ncbi:MAG: clostripain-related cysteine peptidase [Candidatus Margulisiibacteriota bacterium]